MALALHNAEEVVLGMPAWADAHLALSLYTGSLMPGAATAPDVLVPVFSWVLRHAGRIDYM